MNPTSTDPSSGSQNADNSSPFAAVGEESESEICFLRNAGEMGKQAKDVFFVQDRILCATEYSVRWKDLHRV